MPFEFVIFYIPDFLLLCRFLFFISFFGASASFKSGRFMNSTNKNSISRSHKLEMFLDERVASANVMNWLKIE